jgi:SNF2 family DNA or RNA helicase
MALSALRALEEINHGALPALVIAPNSVKQHWANKTPEWAPTAVPYVVEGNVTQRRKVLTEAKKDPNALVIINIEALRQFSRLAPYGSVRLKRCQTCDSRGGEDIKAASCEVHPKELNGFGFKTVICDEAHRCKDPKSKQTRAWWAIAHDPSVTRRWAMTGTPIAQHVGDLWSIMHGVAPYDFPIKSKFIERYALTSWNAFGGLDIVGVKPDTRHELYAILDPHFRRMTKSLVLPQLPKKIRETRYVEMSPAQRKMYKEMARDLLTTTPDGQLLITPNQLSAQIRLSQMAAASIHIEKPDEDDPTTWVWTLKNPSPKLDEFEKVLEDLGDAPCVVCAEHKQLINLAAERLEKLKVPYALITGDISQFDRARALQFLNERKIKALLFTAKAGGTGLDMSAADTIIMLQRPWSMVDNLQAEDRVHRIGSEIHEAIRVIDIVMIDSIEETQIERFYVKQARMEEITRDRDRLRAAGIDTSMLDAELDKIMKSDLGTPVGV